jgi:hypothetical protein
MKNYIVPAVVAVLFGLFAFVKDKNSPQQIEPNPTKISSSRNQPTQPSTPQNSNQNRPQQKVEQVDEGLKTQQSIIQFMMNNGTKCDDFHSARTYCAQAGNGFNACMNQTVGNNFRQIQAECSKGVGQNIYGR